MASITFQPELKELRSVLTGGFFEIPRFQRPYSWSAEERADFWRDVVEDNAAGYFIGPMVVFSLGKQRFGIVDGQQRLTSLTLLLVAIRDHFAAAGRSAQARGLSQYLERTDDEDRQNYVLVSDGAGDYLKEIVTPIEAGAVPRNEEQRAIDKAFNDIRLRLEEAVPVAHLKDPRKASKTLKRLREIRDKVLGVKFIWIRVDKEDDAYVIFETLNSRGKDLEPIDLMKNHVLHALRASRTGLDRARRDWDEMRGTLQHDKAHINPNKFLLHWWLSQRPYTAERKLFRQIRSSLPKTAAQGVLVSLAEDARLYVRLADPESWVNRRTEYRSMRRSLSALNMFGVSQPRPLLLSVMRALEARQIKPGQARRVMHAIESFHFIGTAIVGVSSTGGISEMYAKHARELANSRTDQARARTLNELVGKLADSSRLPGKDTFVSEFIRVLHYSEGDPGRKALVRYTLQRIHDTVAPGSAIDHQKCSIEHIAPQSSGAPWLSEIGNLLWIDDTLNNKLGDKSFEQKLSVLRRFAVTYDLTMIADRSKWSENEVRVRSAYLADLAYNRVWRVRG